MGNIASGAADHHGPVGDHLDYRIIEPVNDPPVMSQKYIGDRREFRKSRLFRDADRPVGNIPARGDERPPDALHNDALQRMMRQHDAQIGRVVGYGGRNFGVRRFGQKDNRRRWRGKNPLCRRRDDGRSPGLRRSPMRTANGFFARLLRRRNCWTASSFVASARSR